MTVKRSDFVHLHVHSDFSLLDGAAPVSRLVNQVKNLGMHSVALTDHGNMFGAVQFYRTALKAGIKPLVGCEAYMAPRGRHERRTEKGMRDSAHHLTILARNIDGYRNLMKLATLAYKEGFYYKPRMDKEILSEYGEGLLILSGCPQSEVSSNLKFGKLDEARTAAGELIEIVGKENFYFEIQDHGMEDERKIQQGGIKLAKEFGLKVVATNDVHYIEKEDYRAHDALLCINTGKRVSDTDRLKYPSNDFYLKTPEEMKRKFAEIPEAVLNTVDVANRCNLELTFDAMHLPRFDPPKGMDASQYLRRLCEEGLKKRYKNVGSEAINRLDFELGVIDSMGFVTYFLIVWDFCRFARENGIPVGPGRGSAVGSLVSYTLGITDLDPLKYDLLFERFLNPSRNEMPDIDIDFCRDRRGEVIDYVREKYGEENVAQIITFGTMRARAVLRDVGRVLDVDLPTVDRVAKKIPDDLNITLRKAVEMEPDLKEMMKQDPKVADMFEIGQRLEGLNRHASKHAAGVVISDKPLTEYVPLYINQGEQTTQYSMEILGDLGLLKMDFLGLKTLTVIQNAVRLIEETTGNVIDIDNVPLDDAKTFELLARGETRGVFQLESRGFRDLLVKMIPDKFDDIIALLALYRPGPLQSGMVDDYINRKHGRTDVEYLTPELEPILAETHGVILYQEQVMRIANKIAGFSLAEADTLRKAMGKKKEDLLARFREQFNDGAEKNGIARDVADELFVLIKHFAGYGFNKSHSTAYAFVSYQTAWLKANYPTQFMAGSMSCDRDVTDKVLRYIEDCHRMEIEVCPPDVNSSLVDFSVKDEKITYGMAAIKGVGERAVEAIIEAREEVGEFASIFHFCEEVNMRSCDKKALEALAKAGAFDGFGLHRSQMFSLIEPAMRMGSQKQSDRASGQMLFFDAGESAEQMEPPDIPEWEDGLLLQNEKESLGFYISSNPLVAHHKIIEELSSRTLDEMEQMQEGEGLVAGVLITSIRTRLVQNGRNAGKKMAFFQVKDFEGDCEAVVFSDGFERCGDMLEEDRVVFLKGVVSFRNEEPSIVVEDVVPIEDARQELTGAVMLRLRAPGLEERTIHQLQAIFKKHPGSIPVVIDVVTHENHSVRVRTDNQFHVTPSDDFIEDIDALVGTGKLRLQPKKFSPRPRFKKKKDDAAAG